MLNNLFLFHTFLPGVSTTPGLLFYSSGSSPAFSIIIKDIKICLVFSYYIYYTRQELIVPVHFVL